MGGKWRVPTTNDYHELLINTDRDVVIINGIYGMLFTSIINGNKMFIPFMQGCFVGDKFYPCGVFANVWTSNIHSSRKYMGYMFGCNCIGNADIYSHYHSSAYSVRGVFIKK